MMNPRKSPNSPSLADLVCGAASVALSTTSWNSIAIGRTRRALYRANCCTYTNSLLHKVRSPFAVERDHSVRSSHRTLTRAHSMDWCLIESDPGVFGELVHRIGARGVAFTELYSLDVDELRRNEPIYGLVFLFKWRGGDKLERS